MSFRGLLFVFLIVFVACKKESKITESSSIAPSEVVPKDSLKVEIIKVSELPKTIKYEGSFKTAVKWSDAAGENLVVLSETGVTPSKDTENSDARKAALFGYHFLLNTKQINPSWRVYDFVDECPLDVVAEFIKNSLEITDLNENGIAEIWLVYKTACRGDVSPSSMKIIMYEGKQKHAMRGEDKVVVGYDDDNKKIVEGGNFVLDSSFQKAPKDFQKHAQDLWEKSCVMEYRANAYFFHIKRMKFIDLQLFT